MGAAVKVTRMDHTAQELRALAAKSKNTAQARRLLAIAMVLEGASRLDAARQTGMDRQTLRDWVHRYNEAAIEGLISRLAPGAAAKLTEAQMAELRELVSPVPTRVSTRWCAGAVSICAGRWPGGFPSPCRNARSANGCASLG
jgi:hypothetical protein